MTLKTGSSGCRLSAAFLLSLLVSGCLEDPGEEGEPLDCAAPTVACDHACRNTSTDPEHCGACGRSCGPSEVCSDAECAGECSPGLSACGRSCLDLASDGANCGGCDRPCATGFSCVDAACVREGGTGGSSDLRVRASGASFNVCGRPIYMNGANTPWDRWDGFGGNFDATFWSDHYGALHDAGVNSSRVWITCSGTVGIDLDADGIVLGATPAHWEDLESFFAIAAERRIYVMATLISFDHFEDGAASRWKAWIASDAGVDSYVENYLLPFLERFGQNPYL